jgi:hypothetical protein
MLHSFKYRGNLVFMAVFRGLETAHLLSFDEQRNPYRWARHGEEKQRGNPESISEDWIARRKYASQ